MAATTTQLNVRLDAELKQRGDATLARAGISPSQVVRMLWRKLAKGGRDAEEAILALSEQEDGSQEEVVRGVELAQAGTSLFEEGLLALGLDPQVAMQALEPVAWKEDREQVISERLRERGVA